MKQPKNPPKSVHQQMKEFAEEYQKLCDKHGFRIVTNPAFQARDDNTWSIVLQTSVGKIPKVDK